MSKRAIYTGLLLVASQLASGCCCVRNTFWRWRCAPCGGGTCAPSFRPVMPPIASPPIASAPLLHHGGPVMHGGPIGGPVMMHGGPVMHGGPIGGADCYGPGPVGGLPLGGGVPLNGGYVGPAGGIPMIGSPVPYGTGPSIERTNELPAPMPVNKDKAGN